MYCTMALPVLRFFPMVRNTGFEYGTTTWNATNQPPHLGYLKKTNTRLLHPLWGLKTPGRYPHLSGTEAVAYCQLGGQLTRNSGLQTPSEVLGGRQAASSSLKENIKDVLKSSGVFALPQVQGSIVYILHISPPPHWKSYRYFPPSADKIWGVLVHYIFSSISSNNG